MKISCTRLQNFSALCLFLLLFGFVQYGEAQISYASTNFASAGDTFLLSRAKLDSLGSANFAQTGANFNWNYSALRPLLQSTDRYIGAATTGYRASFVASCIAGGGGVVACNTQWNNLVNLGHRSLDSIQLGTFSFSDVVQHYNKTGALLPANVLGMTLGLNGINIPMTVPYQRPDSILRFPLTYNKRDSCISKYSIDLTAQGVRFIYKATAKRVNHIEGWGPLTTPYKNYASTLKLKSTITNTDTVIVNGTAIPVPVVVKIEYSWFELNNKRPVMKVLGSVASGATVYSHIEYIDTARCLNPVAASNKTPLVPYLNTTTGSVSVDFNNMSINASQYQWNFGDAASGALNTSTSSDPSHSYTIAGTYSVQLISCNNKCQPFQCDTVTIPLTILDSTNVVANFSYYPLQPCAGDTVKFNNQSLNATNYQWNFGDNTSSVQTNPEKAYSNPGTYDVTLIAINGTSRDTLKQQIAVLGVPAAAFTPAGNFNFCKNDSVYLNASGGNYYQWSDGSVSPILKVKATGIYFVKAFNNCGVSTSASDTIKAFPYVTPTIAINSNEGTTVCAGNSTTFITFAPYAGPNPIYQWKRNSVNVGTNASTYTHTGLLDNDTIICLLTSNYQCQLSSNATSNKIIMTVLPYQTPAVSISASQSNICTGTNVTFYAYPMNGGLVPSYQWKLNNNNVGTNSSSYASNTLANSDVVKCKITSNYQCLNRDTAISPGVTMTVNQATPSVTITANPAGPVCPNTSVTFTATPTNGGAAPTFQWRRNLTNVGTSSLTYMNAALLNNDTIRVIMTSNASCAIPTTATSNVIKMVVGNNLLPSIAITPTPGDSICSGTDVTFTAQGTVTGTNPVFKWKVNSIDTGASLNTFSSAVLEDSAVVTCVMVSNAACATPTTVTSNSVRMKVKPVLEPSISIRTDTNTICEGTSVLFTSSTIHPGDHPVYQWKINNQSANDSSDSFQTTSLINGDIVSCELTSNATCAIPMAVESSGDTMTVLSKPISTITITGSTSFCEGLQAELSAPAGLIYEWNTGDTTQTIVVDSSGEFTVKVTDSNLCQTISDTALITKYPLPAIPIIHRTDDTLYSTQASAYQWFRNDTVLAEDTSRQYLLLNDGNYRVEITDSTGCTNQSDNFSVIGLKISQTESEISIGLYPNPNNGQFVMTLMDATPKHILFTDVTGRKIADQKTNTAIAHFDFSELPYGLYFAEVKWGDSRKILRFSIQ
ncbi:MAG: PKD domain-containing protein [Bacteroidetes bacterium]|nr:PKD domain-containing protein [Bacteroidota bacterium]